ncbi:hypothetical protein QFC19_001671 [Naganishia cerealis]|uniref:Uncharacterized protein n=1 Tax=Naganishia cerealis TaxID=610337 RepID=A0ACC2WFT1_9TREE|nr:hypothetical protein QFC19_001671 [Naganishia cerealis]
MVKPVINPTYTPVAHPAQPFRTFNELSFHRNDTETMTEHLNAPSAKFVLFREGKPLLKVVLSDGLGETPQGAKTETKYDGLYLASVEEVEGYVGDRTFALSRYTDTRTVPSSNAEAKTFQSARLPTSAPNLVFLGIDDRPSSSPDARPAKVDPKKPRGIPYFAIAIPTEHRPVEANKDETRKDGLQGLKEANEFVEPRLAGSSLSPWQANIFAAARAVIGK